ncbi:hypothetical protein M9H77_19102 [Catharanthus roseus]|uniref:Uncharacterized protein n=1 Tax=Catharanthus roseus TaxID=4058 RepID=A0ACC0B9E9_CATRO|nr:hypothetical protein M9H77_19102 [Catharanthus roseus]
MAFRTQQGLQANGIYEFDLLEYLSSSEHIFLLEQQLVQKFHSKSRTAQSKIKTPKGKTFLFLLLRYDGRNFTPQRDNQDHEIGNFLNLMSNFVDGPFKLVSKYFIIFCRRNFGYVGLVKYAINKSCLMKKIIHRFLREFDLALYPRINKSYMIGNDKLNETTNFGNMKLNVEEHEQIIGSTKHDHGAKRKYNILYEDDLLNTLCFASGTPENDQIIKLLKTKPEIWKGNYVVLHHILKCSMSVIDIFMIIRQIDEMNRKRRGFGIEKIDKIGTKGHIFTFLQVRNYDASDICGEMFKCQEL